MDSYTKDSNESKDYLIVDDDVLNDIINSFKIPERCDPFDFSKVDYNNHNKNRGIEFIKENGRIRLNDPYINLVLEKATENILTPLEEWEQRGFVNNNENAKKKIEVTYRTYDC